MFVVSADPGGWTQTDVGDPTNHPRSDSRRLAYGRGNKAVRDLQHVPNRPRNRRGPERRGRIMSEEKTLERYLEEALDRARALFKEPPTYQPETRYIELREAILALYTRAAKDIHN